MVRGIIFLLAPGTRHGAPPLSREFARPLPPELLPPVEVHLASIGMGEGADLEIDDHQSTQAAMEESPVYVRSRIWQTLSAILSGANFADSVCEISPMG